MSRTITSAEAAAIAGVGPTAIKRWADSGVLPCVKTAGGHRRFQRQDVERLVRSGALVSDQDDWSGWIESLSRSADTHTIQAWLFGERARRGSWHGVAEALGGLLTEIGVRWETGRLSVLEEHLASAALARALAAVADAIPVPPEAPRCLLATAEGDDHTLGLSLLELCLREAGWRAEWAGSRTRTEDVIARVRAGGLGMAALSAAVSSSDAHALGVAAAKIGEACRESSVALALGGRGAWPDSPAYGIRLHSVLAFYDHAVTLASEPTGERRRTDRTRA